MPGYFLDFQFAKFKGVEIGSVDDFTSYIGEIKNK
jgi:hypothetical protein